MILFTCSQTLHRFFQRLLALLAIESSPACEPQTNHPETCRANIESRTLGFQVNLTANRATLPFAGSCLVLGSDCGDWQDQHPHGGAQAAGCPEDQLHGVLQFLQRARGRDVQQVLAGVLLARVPGQVQLAGHCAAGQPLEVRAEPAQVGGDAARGHRGAQQRQLFRTLLSQLRCSPKLDVRSCGSMCSLVCVCACF